VKNEAIVVGIVKLLCMDRGFCLFLIHLLVLDCPWILVPWFQIVVVNFDLSKCCSKRSLQFCKVCSKYDFTAQGFWMLESIICTGVRLISIAFMMCLGLFVFLEEFASACLFLCWVLVGTCVWLNACNSACAAFHSTQPVSSPG
jgi:hypothetical protein